jgi:hypothetical protein
MKKSYIELFVAVVITFLVIIYFMDYYSNNRYYLIRNPIKFREPFTLAPDSYDNSKPNEPYALLAGVLPVKEHQVRGPLNSQTCYDHDFQTRLELTGNYIQRTNNYRHEDPESCTSPFQEFVTAFYKVDPLP